ncbi:MAG: GAF domain-containing SpoIIE family protein phosphatase [Candidatus Aquicultorales bacterium]
MIGYQDLVIYFFYGLSYFSMGTALVPALRRRSNIPILKALPWLAAFGILHGIYEWSEMMLYLPAWRDLDKTSLIFNLFHIGLLGTSFGALFMFGADLTAKLIPKIRRIRYLPFVVFITWSALGVSSAIGSDWGLAHAVASASARLFICLPGGLLAAFALVVQSKSLLKKGYSEPVLHLVGAAVFLAAYAVVGGVVGSKAPFWPASVVNKETFLAAFGLPVSVLKMAIAMAVVTFMLLGNRVFDEEESLLREHRKDGLRFLDLIPQKLGDAASFKQHAASILSELNGLVGATCSALFANCQETGAFSFEAFAGLTEAELSERAQPLKKLVSYVHKMAKTGFTEPLYGPVFEGNPLHALVTEPEIGHHFALVPFSGRGKCYGALAVIMREGERLSSEDRHVVKTIGYQIGVALDNALLKEQQRIARLLQRSLLSPRPRLDNLDVGVFYRSATAESMVGGDFYDFVRLSDGRLVVVVGDVAGRGWPAAVLTSNVKNTIRAFIHEDPSPRSVLARANNVMVKTLEGGKFVTAAVLMWFPDNSFVYASAGHPPILIKDGGCGFVAPTQDIPLGIFADQKYEERKGSIKSDDGYVLIYTDGLTELRSGGVFFGETAFVTALERIHSLDAKQIADEVVEAAIDFTSDMLHDDVALVVLRPVSPASKENEMEAAEMV